MKRHRACALLGTAAIAAVLPAMPSWGMTEMQTLLPPSRTDHDYFGRAVALDGATIIIGAYGYDAPPWASGRAHVFTRSGSTWSPQGVLRASDGHAYDLFGSAIALQGDTAVIGAAGNARAAYVFTRSGGWTQRAKLQASDGVQDDFGCSVALLGNTVLVGAYGADIDGCAAAGAVYVFALIGGSWIPQQKLIAPDVAAGAHFGYAVSANGETALIGASGDAEYTGSAYVFTRTGTTWAVTQKLVASDASDSAYFGRCVCIDRDTALIGASRECGGGHNAGAAYVFVRNGGTWTQQAKLRASDTAPEAHFGYSVDLDGDRALIGAPWICPHKRITGAAYLFTRSGSSWTEQAKLLASEGADGDEFGNAVALDGTTEVVGAHYDDVGEVDAGSACVFSDDPARQPPFADFEWPRPSVGRSLWVDFDAGASHDPNGAIVLYEWDWDNDGVYDQHYATPTARYLWDRAGTYSVRLRVTDNDGARDAIIKDVGVGRGVDADPAWTGGEESLGDVARTRSKLSLDVLGPNPFVGRMEAAFWIPASSRVTASVYDVAGRLLVNIVDAEYSAGEHRITWEGRDSAGHRLGAGVYFLRLRAGSDGSTRRVVISGRPGGD